MRPSEIKNDSGIDRQVSRPDPKEDSALESAYNQPPRRE
jgi:hypothetical protein